MNMEQFVTGINGTDMEGSTEYPDAKDNTEENNADKNGARKNAVTNTIGFSGHRSDFDGEDNS